MLVSRVGIIKFNMADFVSCFHDSKVVSFYLVLK